MSGLNRRFVIFEKSTGAVLRTGRAPEEMVALQVRSPSEETLLVDDLTGVAPETHIVDLKAGALRRKKKD